MQDLRYGMTYSNSAVLGQQGNATNPMDNKWLGSWSFGNSNCIYGSSSTVSLSPLYIYTVVAGNTPSNVSGNIINSNYAFGSIFPATGAYSCGVLNLPKKHSGISIHDNFVSNEEYFISRSFSFRLLAINDSMRNSDGDLNDFYTGLQDSSIGKFKAIEDLIGSANPENAESLLSGFDVSVFNRAEQAYYDFYQVFLKYRAYPEELTPADLEQLYEIGNRCPGIDGPAVFQARALLQAITGQVQFYQSECGNELGERAAAQQELNTNQGTSPYLQIDLLLYPNPATNYLIFQTDESFDFNEVIIRDVTQRVCIRQKLICPVNEHQLNLNLTNGLYFITLTNGREQLTGKFCVER